MGAAYDPSDLVYFRNRIGEEGATLILAISAQMYGKRSQEAEIVVDIIVQEKNKVFALYRRMLAQRPGDKNKIYSIHEPQVYCITKGKTHKKYEFGTKASIAMTKSGMIVAAVAHEQNLYDGHTLPEVLKLVEAVTDARPSHAIVDRAYRGRKHVGETEILMPGRPPASPKPSMPGCVDASAAEPLSPISKLTSGSPAATSRALKATRSTSYARRRCLEPPQVDAQRPSFLAPPPLRPIPTP